MNDIVDPSMNGTPAVEIRDHSPIMPLTQIPASVVQAICVVMETMEAVKKSQKNQHGNYMFASTDDIYAAVTAKMGKAGLICMALEEQPPEIKEFKDKDGKPTRWMKVAYLFVLATKDATWTDPRCRRTLFIQITGPQTFQAAQSYAEKSFLRSTFKIPTGDMDLDALPEGFEFNPIQFSKPAPTPPPPAAEPAPPQKEAAAAPEVAEPKQPEDPAPDMAKMLTLFKREAGTQKTEEALIELTNRFNAKFDGHISASIEEAVQETFDANMDRLAKTSE